MTRIAKDWILSVYHHYRLRLHSCYLILFSSFFLYPTPSSLPPRRGQFSVSRRKKKNIYFITLHFLSQILKLINYSCSSDPTRASYSGQVDEFRNPMKNELKTRPWKKPVFETILHMDVNFLNLHIDKATKTRREKQLYLITHFTKQTLNPNDLLLTLNVTEQFIGQVKKKHMFLVPSRFIF